ncbi:MAG: B12-binding domain-containing radical SAM protein [Bacteroidetes bacterium GWF2_38_335]|nr:MAG: B12-binding domain-containing radical SAM protein [Bacteroidetes bacterium GWF2_38_335]OFY79341.1 MAG: B12-binding domain-containing radical SAM protein [Bacteroidetes bacterium RIFOXYA12_FULL_38_20]HBS85600.1 B12-binding domain-containing radical SAM protein [Bacteroidales bacterium]
MKIKLISPRMSQRPTDSYFKRVLSPPLSLVMLATITPKKHSVYIADENTGKINLDDSPNLVGVTVNVDTSLRAFEIANVYRKRGIKVVFGGIHASANHEQMLNHCDAVVIGEAEPIWETLLQDLEKGSLKTVYQCCNAPDLNNVPIPDWSFIDQKKYVYNNVVVASRGCPFKCHFCYNSSKYVSNPFRNRPLENVLEEIKSLKTKQILFIDDNFIGNIEWTKKFISAIKGRGFLWHAAVSADIYQHKDLIEDFASSGCKSLFIGFESINPKSLDFAGKKQNKTEDYTGLINLLHSKGIMVNASLVFGFDNDSPEVFKNTLKWLVKNKIETMTAHILTPYPGTKFYSQLESEDRIIDRDASKYNTSSVVFSPSKMSVTDLQKGYIDMYNNFYSWKNIIRRFPDNKKIVLPYLLFNLGYRKFGRVTSFIGKFGLMHTIGKVARRISYGIE